MTIQKPGYRVTSLIAGLTMALLLAAGNDSRAADSPSGTLRIGLEVLPPSLDLNVTFRPSLQNVFFTMGDALTYMNNTGEVVPALAESWKLVKDTVWEFKLRRGVTFSNGVTVKASDVKFTYDRVLKPENKLTSVTRIKTLKSVEVVDDYTVRFHMKAPDPIWPGRAFAIIIIPEGYFKEVGPEKFSQRPMGTGPFVVREYTPARSIVLDARTDSWRGVPASKTLELFAVKEEAARVTGLQAGQFDVIRNVPLDQAADVLPGTGIQVASAPLATINILEYNQDPVFDDNRVRQALNYAVDKEAIAKSVFRGFAILAPGQMTPSFAYGYNPAVQAFPYDPKKAAALLDAAGWAVNPSTKVREKNGKVLEIVANFAAGDAFNLGESASSEAVAQYLGDVGVKVTLEASERGEYFPRLVKGQNRQHLSHGGWLSVPVLDADFVYSNFSCKERSDRYPVCDPANATYEDLYGRQKHELDEKKRAAYLNELAEWVHERAIAIYLVQPHEVWALGSKVKGFVVRPDRIIRWDSVSSGS